MKKLFGLVLAVMCSMNMFAESHYLVGGSIASGWSGNGPDRSPGAMVKVADNIWVWVGTMTASDGSDNTRFKIPSSDTGWNGYWAPAQNTKLTSEWSSLSENGDGDYKFCVEEAGMYKVTINTSTKQIKADKLVEPSKDGDFYLIATAEDFLWYAGNVTSGNKTAKARLTADISFEGKEYFPIACDKNKFKGEIDGQAHTIDYVVIADTDNDYQGLCRYAADGAHIHDIVLGSHSDIKAHTKAGGFVGFARDGGEVKLTNVINMASVTSGDNADGNAAGFVACAVDGTKITARNCVNFGAISGKSGECAAFAGWTQSGSTFTNCWNNSNSINGTQGMEGGKYKRLYRGDATSTNCYDLYDDQATAFTNEDLTSGKLCYLLNGDQSVIGWYQTIGTDNYPVPFSDGHSQVYGNGALKCDGTSAGGELTYSNTNESVIPPHTNENGWCSVCGALHKEYLSPVAGYYQIGTANDLRWFASYVMDVDATVKAKLTADIDYSAYNDGFIGVPGLPFKGEFDGQEHTLTIAIANRAGVNRTGLFAAINGATIKNLVVEGTATSDNQNCVGGLGGRSDGTSTIENVIVKTAVSYTGTNGDATCGGFFANMEGTAVLKNCAFLGSIKTGSSNGNGGLVGWAGSGNNKYTNCLVAPTEFDESKGDKFARNNPLKTNCHFVAADDARLATGELCYILNDGGDNWYQTLPADVMPVPFSSHSKVYGNASYNCDGTPKGSVVYANVNEEQHDPHTVTGGFCDVCNAMTEYVANYMTPAADGAYEITNNKQMRWFSAMIKDYRNAHSITQNVDADAPVNARLMNDIDFEGVKDYMPIGGLWGQGSTRYAGTFDGQGHHIQNLVINGGNETGIFGVIATGAVIKNFTVDATCAINGGAHVGVVGEAWKSVAGEVHIECVGNEADITGTGNNVGGILGVNMNNGGYAKLYMTNCYNRGTIKGNAENGQLTGWSGDNAVIENCYSDGYKTNCDAFGRLGSGSKATNCYTNYEVNWGPKLYTDEQRSNGELAYLLGEKFSQAIGTDSHPVFGSEAVYGYEISAAEWASYVAPADVEFATDAYVVTEVNNYVVLKQVEKALAGEVVLVNGAAGLYVYNASADAETVGTNMLQASATDVTANGTQYVLAQVEGVVGFHKVTSGTTIAAGKGYLVIAAGAKTFFPFGDEATSIDAVELIPANAAIYNLQGQKLQKLQKGINIINGKKVVIK